MKQSPSGVAVVISGGGARGAYEAGVLSVLLPALEKADQRPDIFLGTSAGAINAVGFAALAHLGAEEASTKALDLWRGVGFKSVIRLPLAALASRRPGPRRATALLDSSPLARTLSNAIDWGQLHDNVAAGRVSVGVVATAYSTRRTAVFLERGPSIKIPATDETRLIDYIPTRLTPDHIRASSAIPVAFPAILLDQATPAAEWYVDGGVRLNTPLKPAIALGAKRVVVVATDPARPAANRMAPSPEWAPTVAGGAAQLLYAMLTDRMVGDLRTLVHKNAVSTDPGMAGPDAIQWVFGGPEPGDAGPLAQLAGEVLQGQTSGQRRRTTNAVVGLLQRSAGRWTARDSGRLELFTHLLFDPDFIAGAIELGQRDARRSLDRHGMPAWHLTDLSLTDLRSPHGAESAEGQSGSQAPGLRV